MSNYRKLFGIIITLAIFASVVLLPVGKVSSTFAGTSNEIYLPLIYRNFPPPPTVFGVESFTFTDPALVQLAADAQVSWVRIPAFDWSKIEPTKGTYDWSQVPESSLVNIADNHMHAIATVKMTPSWAQKYSGVFCGPISEDAFDEFVLFVQAAVQRYSKAPYYVKYWEFGNEPDVDHDLLSDMRSVFGCWGDDGDPYYGGGYYAELLKVVYPAIKAIDPTAKILIGGLLLDCDPEDPDCIFTTPPKFFEGILQNGGGDFFDIVSYHGYPYYSNGIIHDEDFVSWDERGGVVLGKAAFLKELMAQYGVSKPLFHTEGALLCPEWNKNDCDPPGAIYEDAKADYVVWLFVRAMANDFEGSIWYTLDGGGWRNGGLIGDSSDPNPAYYVFEFMTKELSEAQYIGEPLPPDENIRSYAFDVPDKTVWVVYSVNNEAHSITLPSGYTQVLDKFGNPISAPGGVLDVKSPIYIELPK